MRSARTSVQQEIEIKQEQTEDIFVFLFSTLSIFNFRIMSFDTIQELLSFAIIVTCFSIPSPLYLSLIDFTTHTKQIFPSKQLPHLNTCAKSSPLAYMCVNTGIKKHVITCILSTCGGCEWIVGSSTYYEFDAGCVVSGAAYN